MSRRSVLVAGLAGAAVLTLPARAAGPERIEWAQFAERRASGRLGIAIVDTANWRTLAYRGDERFPMCSTFKLLAVGQVLAHVDAGREDLEREIPYGIADLLAHAPVTRVHVVEGQMTLGDLCAAAIQQSDNTAANLILKQIGGPDGVTAYARTLGDSQTRLDRNEPDLNTALKDDPRDTTTPNAMAADTQRLLFGEVLSAASRTRMAQWMIGTTTGLTRIRAGVPQGWRVGDKTGTNGAAATNDVAVLWPPNRSPIVVAAYLHDSAITTDAGRDAVMADIGRQTAEMFSGG